MQYQLTSADKGSRTGRCCRCLNLEGGLAEPKRQQGLFVPYFPSGSANEMLDYCSDKFVTSKSFVQLVRSCFYLFTIQTCECHFKHSQDFWLLLREMVPPCLEFSASKRITKQLFIPVVTVSHKSTLELFCWTLNHEMES